MPYGTAIDEGMLLQIERAESALLTLGFSQFRVRHHGDVARLEIVPEEFEAALHRRDAIVERVKACGYRFVALDLAGFRVGFPERRDRQDRHAVGDGLVPSRSTGLHGPETGDRKGRPYLGVRIRSTSSRTVSGGRAVTALTVIATARVQHRPSAPMPFRRDADSQFSATL